MSPNESDSNRRRYRLNRRRLLQLTGVGVGSLTMTTAGSSTARAETGCANGPFERTYTAETVNISKVAKRQKEWGDETIENPPAVEDTKLGKADKVHAPPPASVAQQAPDATGLLNVGQEYDGIRDSTILPPGFLGPKAVVPPSDSQLAVGRSKTVQAINNEIAIFNQRSGTLELEVPFENFFEPLITEEGFIGDIPNVADPRARYDPDANRFVLSAFYIHIPSWSGAWFLAVSADSNPNGTWHLYRISTYSGGWPDYPPMGLDQDTIYLTGFTVPETIRSLFDLDIELAILDKQALYDGEEVTVNHFTGLFGSKGLYIAIQPAFQPFSGGQSGSYYLVGSQTQKQVFNDEPDTGLTLWEVRDPLDEPSLSCSVLEVEPFSGLAGSDPQISGAPQPNTDLRLSVVGDRLMNLDYSDGSLWTAHAIRYNWDEGPGTEEDVTAVRWYEIDPTNPEVIQSGTYGDPGTAYFLPHITSDGDRTLMSYNVSGPETFPSIEVAGRTADFTQGKMEASVVIQEGQSSMIHPTTFGRRGDIDPVWWGDYMGISVHPTTGRFWVTGQYSPDFDVPLDGEEPDRYQTHIAEVSFDDDNGRR